MSLTKDSNGNVVQLGQLGASTDLATSAVSASYTVVGVSCFALRVVASTDTRVRVGAGTVTAITTDTLLPAGVPEYVAASAGQKIAAVSASAGTLNITEIV